MDISFEFFPPNTSTGLTNLLTTAQQLHQVQPKYFSVTFGAGGANQHKTIDTVLELNRTTDTPIAPHISCINTNQAKITELLTLYKKNNIRRLVTIRGDLPASNEPTKQDFPYSSDLIAFIRQQTGSHFYINAAAYPECHPEADCANHDLQCLQTKFAKGADSAITQYFFNPDAYFYYAEAARKLGIRKPIIPGIMPITNFQQLARFSERCGAEIPRWLRMRLAAYGDDLTAINEFGIEVISRLCETLIKGGAPGLHFYTLNKAKASLAILKNLGITSSVKLASVVGE